MGLFFKDKLKNNKYEVGDRVRVKLTLDEGYVVCVIGEYCEVEIDGRNKIEAYKINELEKIFSK